MRRQVPFQPDALRRARRAAGMTQSELARRIGVAGGERVSVWELGLAVPRAPTLLRIANALHVDPDELQGGQPLLTLRSLRRSAGLSLDELASRVHVSRATIHRWEASTSAPELPTVTLRLLAVALDVDVQVVSEAISGISEA